eukprot:jgi/Picre1/28648/NNA_004048.t1
MSKTRESQTVGQNLGRTELPSFFLLDVVLIPDDEEYISKYKEYIYGDGSNRGGPNQGKSAGPSSSSRPFQFGFGQQFALKQEVTPPQPTAENASGSSEGRPNQGKSAGPSSSSRPGHFGFGQQFAFRQEATPPQPTADNATDSSEGRPKQDNSAGPSSSSRPGHFGFGQQFALRQEATPSRPTAESASGSNRGGPNQDKSAGLSSSSRPGQSGFGQQSPLKQEVAPPQPTGDSTSLSSRAARRKMRVCRNRWETASNGGDSMHPQFGRINPNGVPWRKTTVREEYDHGAIWYVQLDSISAMKEYASKSVEELRWEHSQNTVTKDLAVIESYSCLEKPTPFLMAVLQGRLGLCKVFSHSQWLWERRWPMYRTDVKACSQIMMGVFVACIHGRVDMFECLLKALLEGGIVSSATALSRIMQSRDENRRTPCILASMHGHNDVLQSFIALLKTPTVSAGSLSPWTAHVNAQDRLGKTALMYACESGNPSDCRDPYQTRDHKEIILALINAGADLSINGKQIMIGAAEKGDLEMLQTFIKLNFDLNRKCIAGRTAVMFAVHEDQEEAVQTLLKAGADAAVRDENDDTILTLAAEHASARMVNLCLEYIPAEMIDSCTLHERWTALMLASKRGDEDIVKALLKAGASVLHKRDIQMMSTIDLVSNGDLENKNAILELLREREAAERLVEQMSIQQISECDQGDSIAYDDLNIETDRTIGRGSFSIVKMATWRGMDVAVKELTSNLSLDTQDILRSEIATDTAEGMTYLHKAKNYYHRDLRTANILITSRYQAKISDMGLTKKALKVSRNSAGTIAASTPRWLAPEILSNGPFTSKSDVYSFGTVLYELATWKQPWAGIEEYGIPHLILVKKERLTIPDLESIPGPQPTDGETFIKFREIADRCLAVDPSDRPEFEEIVSELKQILRREQTPEDQQMSSCINKVNRYVMQGNNGNGANLHGMACHACCHDMDQASLAYHHTLAMHLMHSMGTIYGAHSPAGGSRSRGCHSGLDAAHASHGINVSGGQGCHSGMDGAHGGDIHAAHGINVSGGQGCHPGMDAAHGGDIHAAHGVNVSGGQGCHSGMDAAHGGDIHAAHGINVSGGQGCHSGMDAAHGADIHAAHGVNVSGGCHSGMDAAHGGDIHAAHGGDVHAAHGVNVLGGQGCHSGMDAAHGGDIHAAHGVNVSGGCHSGMDAAHGGDIHAAHGINVSGGQGCHSGMDAGHGGDIHAAHGVNVSGGCHSGMDGAHGGDIHAAHGGDVHAAHGVNVSGGCHSGMDAAHGGDIHAAHGGDVHAAHGVNVSGGCHSVWMLPMEVIFTLPMEVMFTLLMEGIFTLPMELISMLPME